MRHFMFLIAIVVLGAVVLVPVINLVGLDPLPGDFTIRHGDFHLAVPVTYSLCASTFLGLFYYVLKR